MLEIVNTENPKLKTFSEMEIMEMEIMEMGVIEHSPVRGCVGLCVIKTSDNSVRRVGDRHHGSVWEEIAVMTHKVRPLEDGTTLTYRAP